MSTLPVAYLGLHFGGINSTGGAVIIFDYLFSLVSGVT